MKKSFVSMRDESGSALLELTLILPVICLMLAAVVDLGLGIQQSMVVAEAARAGTAFGSIPGNDMDYAGMQRASAGAGVNLQSFTATASEWCSCSPNGALVNCTGSCPSGGKPLAYVQVTTSAVLPAAFNYVGLPASFNLSGFSAIRVR